MRTFLKLRSATAIGLIAVTLTASAGAPLPVISGRTYGTGSAKVKVTGAFQFDAVIPINKQASFSDGEMTWIQYGDSGSEQPNLLVTVSLQELGFGIGLVAGFGGMVGTTIIACLVVGSIVLAPAIVFGYAVKAAEREDRELGH